MNEMPDKFAGEGLLQKMWESLVDNGIGNLLKTWQIRRVGKAQTDVKADEIKRLSEAMREATAMLNNEAQVEIKGSAVKLLYAPSENKDSTSVPLPQFIAQRQIAEGVKKEVNIAKAILHAEAELENDDSSPPKDSVDTDWLFQWQQAAGSVSNEEMQSLWGKILAGEVKKPGTYSLRTLDFLRNTTQREAEQISMLAPFAISGSVWHNSKSDYLKTKGVTFGFLLRLQQLGIISGVEAISGLSLTLSTVKEGQFLHILKGADKALVLQNSDESKTAKLKSRALTYVGHELMRLCNASSDIEYLRALGKEFVGQGFDVSIARYRDHDGKTEWWDEEVLVAE